MSEFLSAAADDDVDIQTPLEDMTAEASLSLADSLMIDEQLDEAVDVYAAAISLLSDSSAKDSHRTIVLHIRALSHRSAAFYQLKRYQDALEDAQNALKILSAKHPEGLRAGDGELCHKRAGLAALQLGDLANAKNSLEQAKQLATLNRRPGQKTAADDDDDDGYTEWIRKCTPTPTHMVEEIPSRAPAASPSAALPASIPPPTIIPSTLRPQMPKYQYYQSDTVMTISILEANVTPGNLNVTFEPKKLTVQLLKGGVDFTVICGTLYSEVVVDRCKVVYKDEKVLIKLRKKDSFEWHELFGRASSDDDKPPAAVVASSSSDRPKPVVGVVPEGKTRARPYATDKDWEAIEREVVQEEKNAKPEGDEAMNKLFQQIYANASEETRRAMIKSYQTSGGTVLSTNWDEVSKTDYETKRTAPKGIEWKNWEGKKLPVKDDD